MVGLFKLFTDIVCSLPPADAIPEELGDVFAEECASVICDEVPKVSSVGVLTQFSVKVPQSMGTTVEPLLTDTSEERTPPL